MYIKLYGKGFKFTAKFFYWINRIVFSCDIPCTVTIGKRLHLPHFGLGVILHPCTKIGDDVTIYQQVTIGARGRNWNVEIGNNVLLGAGCTILSGITIGDGITVGASTCVSKSIERQGLYISQNLTFKNFDPDMKIEKLGNADYLSFIYKKNNLLLNMSLRNIIIVNDFAHINGGAGKVAINSAIALSELGYYVTLFAAVGPIDDSLKKSKVKVICLWQKDILTDSNRLRAIEQGIWNKSAKDEFIKLLATISPNETIIHFHAWIKSLSASLFKAVAKRNFKIVITLHDYFLFCPNGGLFNYQKLKICSKKASSINCLLCNCDIRSYPQKIWRYLRQIVQWEVVKNIKNINIIYISKLNKEISYPYLKNISKKWYFVQNPIDLNKQSIVNIQSNNKYLFMGRLSSEKGIKLFCKAIRDLHLNGLVLGDGYLKEALQLEYPEIEFRGWVTGEIKNKLIHQSKALVFPSLWYEGAPLTIIEMKSYGIPCIVPDKCSASEEIIDGETGLVFESGNLESLKDAIRKYENSDKLYMQNSIIRTFCVEKYSLLNHSKTLIDVYSDILKES